SSILFRRASSPPTWCVPSAPTCSKKSSAPFRSSGWARPTRSGRWWPGWHPTSRVLPPVQTFPLTAACTWAKGNSRRSARRQNRALAARRFLQPYFIRIRPDNHDAIPDGQLAETDQKISEPPALRYKDQRLHHTG